MLQNREVGGATMGAGQGAAPGQMLYGPWGYANFAAAVALFSAYLGILASGLDDPLGMRWVWASTLLVLLLAGLGALTRRYGMESDRRHARGARDARYRIQQLAPFGVLALLLTGLVGHVAGADQLTVVMAALAVGATAGLAPTFLLKPTH